VEIIAAHSFVEQVMGGAAFGCLSYF